MLPYHALPELCPSRARLKGRRRLDLTPWPLALQLTLPGVEASAGFRFLATSEALLQNCVLKGHLRQGQGVWQTLLSSLTCVVLNPPVAIQRNWIYHLPVIDETQKTVVSGPPFRIFRVACGKPRMFVVELFKEAAEPLASKRRWSSTELRVVPFHSDF